MALETVNDYVQSARTLLQDEVEEYRYSTASLIDALNIGLMEIRRIRPDIMKAYYRTAIPTFSTSTTTSTVPLPDMYRSALLYYVCGQVQMRDDEATQDARAGAFMQKFVGQLLTVAA
jgi:hypothetical protein